MRKTERCSSFWGRSVVTTDSGPENFSEWDVENLRLSVFTPNDLPMGLWSVVAQAEPESIDRRPRDRTATEAGPMLGNVLKTITQPGRIDWLFQFTVLPTRRIHTLSNVPDSIATLRRSLATTLAEVSYVDRLAFGASLIKQVDSQREGVQTLSPYLSHLPLTGDIRDFMHRVNRRRRLSSDPRVQVNRLATWSVEEIISLRIAMPQGRIAMPQGRVDVGPPDLVRKLLLDINTVPSGARASGKARPWFDELVVMAIEIAAKGDIE